MQYNEFTEPEIISHLLIIASKIKLLGFQNILMHIN